GLHARGHFSPRVVDRAGLLRVTGTRASHRARHQHLRPALMLEIAIGEAHAGDGAAEADFILLVEIEAGLERHAAQRGAHRLATDLKRIAGKTDMPDRP